MIPEETQEDIERHYSAMLDSVNLIKRGKSFDMIDEDWELYVERNIEHLRIMREKDFWTDEDFTEIDRIIEEFK